MQAQLHLPSSGCKHRGPPSAARMSPILYRRSGWGGFYQLGGPASPVSDSLLCSLSALQELQLDSDPEVRRAALETLKILDTCSQQPLLSSPGGFC